jgi:hypothetical protein
MALKRHRGTRERERLPSNRTPKQNKTKTANRQLAGRPRQFKWAEAITPDQWVIYQRAICAVRDAGVPFLLGGGFALATYTGRWRDTKDIDLYVHPRDRQKTIEALTAAGFADYFSTRGYDRRWIYRSTKDDFIVDIIWAMANQRAQVDDLWFERAGSISIRDESLKILPMEEFMWCKLYILQRDHCDWTDLFNLLYANGKNIDWKHLLMRLEEDTPLLRAVLELFGWLCPAAIQKLSPELWRGLKMACPQPPNPHFRRKHIPLLDSRGWFAAEQPPGKKLEV